MDEEWTKQLTSAIVSFLCFFCRKRITSLFLFFIYSFFWLRRQGQSVHPEKKHVELELERLLLRFFFFFYQPWMKKSISAFQNKSLAAAAATSLCLSADRAAEVRCIRSQTSCNEHATTESPHKSPLERATLPGDKITPELIDYVHRHIFFFNKGKRNEKRLHFSAN